MQFHQHRIWQAACLLLCCAALLAGCSDDDNDSRLSTSVIQSGDARQGYFINSTAYRMVIDLEEQEDFTITLQAGQILAQKLAAKETHVAHVVLLDANDRAVADYVNSFYINEIPLDQQYRDFICSWYVDFLSLSGFGNDFGA